MIDRFGEKLRQLRLEKGLNQTTLAHRLGYKTQAYLSELESGKKKPTAEFVLKVSRFFHVSCDVLLKDELELEDETLNSEA